MESNQLFQPNLACESLFDARSGLSLRSRWKRTGLGDKTTQIKCKIGHSKKSI